jgi:penicillin-binding protein 1C
MAGLRRGGAFPHLPEGQPGLAIALGGLGLSLQDLVQLYAGLAQGGGPVPVLHLDAAAPARRTGGLTGRAAAWHVGDILSDIQPPAGQPRGHVAFKTGTSYGHRDAWAIGWDGAHVVGVWLGRADGTPVPGIFGGEVAAPILFEAFERVAPRRTPLPPPPPETLIAPTALLPTPLQRFERGGEAARSGVRIAFPPDAARVRLQGDGGLVLRLDGGMAPFAILADGKPVQLGVETPRAYLTGLVPGFSQLQVIDATGRSDSVAVRLD